MAGVTRLSGLLAACLLSGTAAAQPLGEAGATATVEHLDNGASRWRELAFDLQRMTPEDRLSLQARRAERYGSGDREIAAGYARRFAPGREAGLRASAADGRFLARRSVGAGLAWPLGDGVNLLLDGRRLWFRPDDAPASAVTLAGADVEVYRGAWRWVGGLVHARLDGGPGVQAGRVQVDRYFGDTHRLGLALAGGREVEASPEGVLTPRVRSLALLARWGLGDGWMLDLSLARTRVSDVVRPDDPGRQPGAGYRRDGAALGVRRRF